MNTRKEIYVLWDVVKSASSMAARVYFHHLFRDIESLRALLSVTGHIILMSVSRFQILFFLIVTLTISSGLGAAFIVLMADNQLTTAQEDLFVVLQWVFISGSTSLLILLGAYFNIKK